MSPPATYALITFLAGVIALLGWLYANAANPQAGSLLGKSVGIFAIPIVFMPGGWVMLHIGMWAAVAFRGAPASITATRRRARPITNAALKPAAPPPTTTTSYRFASMAITSCKKVRQRPRI